MKKYLLLAIFVGVFVVMSVAAHADFKPTWEFAGGASVAFGVQSKSGSGPSQLSATARPTRYLMDQFAIYADPTFLMLHSDSTSTTVTTFSMTVGPLYNFSANVSNSFYVLGGVGFLFVGSVLPQSSPLYAFRYQAGVGKRFELAPQITWSPEIVLQGNPRTTATSGANVTTSWPESLDFTFKVVQFSLLF